MVFSFHRNLTLRWSDMVVLGSNGGGIIYQNALQIDYDLSEKALFVNSANRDSYQFTLLNGTIVTPTFIKGKMAK